MISLYINGRFLSQRMTGVQRYSWELMNALDQLQTSGRISDKHNILCIAPKDIIYEPSWKNIKLLQDGQFSGNVWEQINLPYIARRGLLFSPSNIGPVFHPRQIVTIHDASVFAVPWSYQFFFRMKYQLLLKYEVAHSLHIITDLIFSKNEIIKYCSGKKEKISTIYPGGDHFRKIIPDGDVLNRYNIKPNKYFLIVGSRTGHKNHNLITSLSEAFPFFQFILVGFKSKIFRDSNYFLPSTRILDLEYVTDSELKALYNSAKALIFPSLYEGFGFPILEALECGCPVIASNAASIPEVGGGVVHYFDPNNPQSAIESIKNNILISNNGIHQFDYSHHLNKFKWSETGINIWNVISDYLN